MRFQYTVTKNTIAVFFGKFVFACPFSFIQTSRIVLSTGTMRMCACVVRVRMCACDVRLCCARVNNK